nr:VOC family protein [uncultured Celeribacter sp.]
MPYRIDHLVVTAADLNQGRNWVETLLETRLETGGQHDEMGTHNSGVRLDPKTYLEVLAPDPEAEAPAWRRWFDIDNVGGPPKLGSWVVSCPDLEEAWERAPSDVGRIMSFRRGPYIWRMIVPWSGVLPFDNCFPALVEWHSPHPTLSLPEAGLSLRRLRITHPNPNGLRAALSPFVSAMEHVRIVEGTKPGLSAEIGTPSGEVWIS